MNFVKINISRNSFVLNDESILTSRSLIIDICIQLSTINSPDGNLLCSGFVNKKKIKFIQLVVISSEAECTSRQAFHTEQLTK